MPITRKRLPEATTVNIDARRTEGFLKTGVLQAAIFEQLDQA
jgi:hypothetical protein